MFIYNLKLNSNKIFKLVFIIIIAIVIFLCGIVAYKLYKESIKSGEEIQIKTLSSELNDKNFTNILKMVHDDIDTYIGQKIKYSGYVYRVYDLESNQFVLARNMVISSDFQTVVVGFLCNYNDAIKYKDNTWVSIEGIIDKYNYHGSYIPIIKITSIKEIEKTKEEFVYPPDENYIPTSLIL